MERERLDRARGNGVGDVFDRAAFAAAKVRVTRPRRLVGRRVESRYVEFGDQTEVAQAHQAAIDG